MSENTTLYFYKEVEVDYKGKKETRRQTIAGIVDGNTLRIGVAECSPKDSFTKSKGRHIAIGRAKSKKGRVVDLDGETKPARQFIDLVK